LKYGGYRASRIGASDSSMRNSDKVDGRPELSGSDQHTKGGSSFSEQARDAYHRLSAEGLRNLPIEPLFVYLDVESSAAGAAVGESHRLFKESENKQNAFIIFQQDGREGWLFPNPRISYTESMRYVFPGLSYENFTEFKQKIDPARVRTSGDGMWELLPN
jgi:hypothetical protein